MYNNWLYFIQQVILFKQQYGHCCIPDIFPPNQPLATWARLMRTKKMLGKLTKAQFTELNELEFAWSSNNRRFEQNLFDLSEFYKKHRFVAQIMQAERCQSNYWLEI